MDQSGESDDVFIDDGTYFESLAVTKGQSLQSYDFVENDTGIVIVDGGADSAFTVTGTTWAEFIDLTVRGNENGIIASTPVFVKDNVFDDPDAANMIAVQLLPGADGSIINSNDFVDPFPSYARMRGGVSSIAKAVVIANNTMSGLNFGIGAGSNEGDPSLISGNVIEGIHNWPVQGRGISAGYSVR